MLKRSSLKTITGFALLANAALFLSVLVCVGTLGAAFLDRAFPAPQTEVLGNAPPVRLVIKITSGFFIDPNKARLFNFSFRMSGASSVIFIALMLYGGGERTPGGASA